MYCQGLKWAGVFLYFISFFFWNNTGTATAVQKLWLRCFDIYPVKVQMISQGEKRTRQLHSEMEEDEKDGAGEEEQRLDLKVRTAH